jgi:hypothetical protein
MKNQPRAATVLLAALFSFAVTLEASQPGHAHGGGRLGLYNAECPLLQLAAVQNDGLLPAPLAIASPRQVAAPMVATSSGWVSSPFPALADSRAPPFA